MTAVTVYADKAGAYFMTDTAAYDGQQVVLGWRTKAVPFSRLGLVISTSGKVGDGEALRSALWKVSDYEEALREFPQILEDASDGFDDDLDVFIGGWSIERRCGEAYRICTRDWYEEKAFVMHRKQIVSSTEIPHSALKKTGVMNAAGQLVTNDPETMLTGMIRAQRITPWNPDPEKPGQVDYCVGGAAELTVINASGIHQRVVLRWPDQIGEKIDPTRDVEPVKAAPPAANDGLSRLQRERQKKKNQKALRRAS